MGVSLKSPMFFCFNCFIFMQYINTPPPEVGANYAKNGVFPENPKFYCVLVLPYNAMQGHPMQHNIIMYGYIQTGRLGEQGCLARAAWPGLWPKHACLVGWLVGWLAGCLCVCCIVCVGLGVYVNGNGRGARLTVYRHIWFGLCWCMCVCWYLHWYVYGVCVCINMCTGVY